MGLDMYLKVRKSFNDRDWSNDEDKEVCKKIRAIFPDIYKTGNLDTITVGFEAGYWRKANAIHSWFVENVQGGEDDCEEYYVNRSDLKNLLESCLRVLENSELVDGKVNNGYTFKDGKKVEILEDGKTVEDSLLAEEILPTQEGFFFGGTDYDEYYIHDIQHTVEVIDKVLDLPKGWYLYYRSSW